MEPNGGVNGEAPPSKPLDPPEDNVAVNVAVPLSKDEFGTRGLFDNEPEAAAQVSSNGYAKALHGDRAFYKTVVKPGKYVNPADPAERVQSVSYLHCESVVHKGVLVVFVLRSDARFSFTVLNLESGPRSRAVNATESYRNTLDKFYWQALQDDLVPFPNEVGFAGASVADPTALRGEDVFGQEVRSFDAKVRDAFRSTTARLTEPDAPFRLMSDDEYIYLFRHSVAGSDDMNVSISSGKVDENGNDVTTSLVDRSILLDRFVLVQVARDETDDDRTTSQGQAQEDDAESNVDYKLVPKTDVRYQRSRSKTRPADSKDTLSPVDKDGRLFFESTLELSFLGKVEPGFFDVLTLPTSVPMVSRWLFHVKQVGRSGTISIINVERSSEGLFNTQGSTEPVDTGHAESALRFVPADATQWPHNRERKVAFKLEDSSLHLGDNFAIEMWVRPDNLSTDTVRQGRTILGGTNIETLGSLRTLNAPPTVAVKDRGTTIVIGWGTGESFVECQFLSKLIPSAWNHIALVLSTEKIVPGSESPGNLSSSLRLYLNGVLDRTKRLPDTVWVLPEGSEPATGEDGRGSLVPKSAEEYVEGIVGSLSEEEAASITLARAWGSRDNVQQLQTNPISVVGGAIPFRGEVDEIRIWSTVRSREQISSRSRIRLDGSEFGLEAYFRMDEGAGIARAVANPENRVFGTNIRDSAVGTGDRRPAHGTLKASEGPVPEQTDRLPELPEDSKAVDVDNSTVSKQLWVTSTAPIGVSSALYREEVTLVPRLAPETSFRLERGLSSVLYYSQQESPAQGYSDEARPLKRAARVLVSVPVAPSASDSTTQLAVLDFGVRGFGLTALIPDTVALSELKSTNPDNKDEGPFPMSLLATDSTGLTLTGGLLPGSQGCGPPSSIDSAVGDVALYCPQETSDGSRILSAFHRSNLTETATFRLETNDKNADNADVVTVSLEARSTEPEYDEMTIAVMDDDPQEWQSKFGQALKTQDADPDRCTVVITGPPIETEDQIIETWFRVPRNAKQFLEVLSGAASTRFFIGSATVTQTDAETILRFERPIQTEVKVGDSLAFTPGTSPFSVEDGARFVVTQIQVDEKPNPETGVAGATIHVLGVISERVTTEKAVFWLEYDYESYVRSTKVPSNYANGSLLVKPASRAVSSDTGAEVAVLNQSQILGRGKTRNAMWYRSRPNQSIDMPTADQRSLIAASDIDEANKFAASSSRDLTIECWIQPRKGVSGTVLAYESPFADRLGYEIHVRDLLPDLRRASPLQASIRFGNLVGVVDVPDAVDDDDPRWVHLAGAFRQRYAVEVGGFGSGARDKRFVDCGNSSSLDLTENMTISTSITLTDDAPAGVVSILQRGFDDPDDPGSVVSSNGPYALQLRRLRGRRFRLDFKWKESRRVVEAESPVYDLGNDASCWIVVTRERLTWDEAVNWNSVGFSGFDDQDLSLPFLFRSQRPNRQSQTVWRVGFSVLRSSPHGTLPRKVRGTPDLALFGEDVYVTNFPTEAPSVVRNADRPLGELVVSRNGSNTAALKFNYLWDLERVTEGVDDNQFEYFRYEPRLGPLVESQVEIPDEKIKEKAYALNFAESNKAAPLLNLISSGVKVGGARSASTKIGVPANTSIVVNSVRIWSRVLNVESTPLSYTLDFKSEKRPNDLDAITIPDLLAERSSSGLVGRWEFDEGPVSSSSANLAEEATDVGTFEGNPRIVKAKDLQDFVQLYVNGVARTREGPFELKTSRQPSRDSVNRLCVAADTDYNRLVACLVGEVRAWQTMRPYEQILDMMFSVPPVPDEDILFSYAMEVYKTPLGDVLLDSSRKSAFAACFDENGEQSDTECPVFDWPLNLRIRGKDSSESGSFRLIDESCPIGAESPVISASAAETKKPTRFMTTDARSGSRIGSAEYAEVQRNGDDLQSFLKRAYCFIRESGSGGSTEQSLVLVSSFFLAGLDTEWIGQVQFDPTMIGYIEGAPPVPAENLNKTDDGYHGASSIQMVQTTTTSKSSTSTSESTIGFSASGSVGVEAGGELDVGFIVSKQVLDIEGSTGVTFGGETSLATSKSESYSTSDTVTSIAGMELRGAVSDSDSQYLPENIGSAVVKSRTADVYAIRLRDESHALVATTTIPNLDIDPDLNVITFPINPLYQVQGSLDGGTGGSSAAGGEGSYMRPREAYALKKRIEDDAMKRKADITSEGLARAIAKRRYLQVPGLVLDASGASEGRRIERSFLRNSAFDSRGLWKKDIVNTYVWSADTGLAVAQTSGGADSYEETYSGSIGFEVSAGINSGIGVEVGGFGFSAEYEASASFGLTLTEEKGQGAEKAFELEVDVSGVESDIYASDSGLDTGTVSARDLRREPGKVDAYRFMTFWLSPSTDNFTDFFQTVVDPVWLNQSSDSGAVLMRQIQSRGRNSPGLVFRIFHRVTFVSRILPEFGRLDAPAPSAVEDALQSAAVSSNFELVRMLEGYVAGRTGNAISFRAAVREGLVARAPELLPSLDAIVGVISGFFDVGVVDNTDDDEDAAQATVVIETPGARVITVKAGSPVEFTGRFFNPVLERERLAAKSLAAGNDPPSFGLTQRKPAGREGEFLNPPPGYFVEWLVESYREPDATENGEKREDGRVEQIFSGGDATRARFVFSTRGVHTVSLLMLDGVNEIRQSVEVVVNFAPVISFDGPVRLAAQESSGPAGNQDFRAYVFAKMADGGRGDKRLDRGSLNLEWAQVAGPRDGAAVIQYVDDALTSNQKSKNDENEIVPVLSRGAIVSVSSSDSALRGRYLLQLSGRNLVYSSGERTEDMYLDVGVPSTNALEAEFLFRELRATEDTTFDIEDSSTERRPEKDPAPGFHVAPGYGAHIVEGEEGVLLSDDRRAPLVGGTGFDIHPILQANAFSMELLIRVDEKTLESPTPIFGLYGKGGRTGHAYAVIGQLRDALYLSVKTNQNEGAWTSPSSSDVSAIASFSRPADGQDKYIHFIATWTGARTILYVNGVETSRRLPVIKDDLRTLDWTPSVTRFSIGGHPEAQTDSPWVGALSLARVYSTELSSLDVRTHYEAVKKAAASGPRPIDDWVLHAGPDRSLILPQPESTESEESASVSIELSPRLNPTRPNPADVSLSWSSLPAENVSITETDEGGGKAVATFSAVGRYVLRVRTEDGVASDWFTVIVNSRPDISEFATVRHVLSSAEGEPVGVAGVPGLLNMNLPSPSFGHTGDGLHPQAMTALTKLSKWRVRSAPSGSAVVDPGHIDNARAHLDFVGIYEFVLEARNERRGVRSEGGMLEPTDSTTRSLRVEVFGKSAVKVPSVHKVELDKRIFLGAESGQTRDGFSFLDGNPGDTSEQSLESLHSFTIENESGSDSSPVTTDLVLPEGEMPLELLGPDFRRVETSESGAVQAFEFARVGRYHVTWEVETLLGRSTRSVKTIATFLLVVNSKPVVVAGPDVEVTVTDRPRWHDPSIEVPLNGWVADDGLPGMPGNGGRGYLWRIKEYSGNDARISFEGRSASKYKAYDRDTTVKIYVPNYYFWKLPSTERVYATLTFEFTVFEDNEDSASAVRDDMKVVLLNPKWSP